MNPRTRIGCPLCGSENVEETTQHGFGFPLEHFSRCLNCGVEKVATHPLTLTFPTGESVTLISRFASKNHLDAGAPSG